MTKSTSHNNGRNIISVTKTTTAQHDKTTTTERLEQLHNTGQQKLNGNGNNKKHHTTYTEHNNEYTQQSTNQNFQLKEKMHLQYSNSNPTQQSTIKRQIKKQ